MDRYATQTPYSDPGRWAPLFDALPADIRELTAVVRNCVVHYVAAGIAFEGQRLAEINHRWLDEALATDQRRHGGAPLGRPRAGTERVVGCCRDFTLWTVAALRHRGVPARSRLGFARYFGPQWTYDHVVAEYWDGARWVWVDAQLDPAAGWPFDPVDVPRGPFATAADVWTAYRAGEIDVSTYGVAPGGAPSGAWFARDQVIQEVAHRYGDELLLWDSWGDMGPDLVGGLDLIDEVAALLIAADGGSAAAERELEERYATDRRLRPGPVVDCPSPDGTRWEVDLRRREQRKVAGVDSAPGQAGRAASSA
jgi:hypothetical protein